MIHQAYLSKPPTTGIKFTHFRATDITLLSSDASLEDFANSLLSPVQVQLTSGISLVETEGKLR